MDSEQVDITEPLNINLTPVDLKESLKKPSKQKRKPSVRKHNGAAPGTSNGRLRDLPPEEWKQIENLAKIRAPIREIAAKHDLTPAKLTRMIQERYRMPLSQWLDSKHDYARLFLRAKAWEMATDGKHPILTMVHLFNMIPEEFKDVKQIIHRKEDNGESSQAIAMLTKLFKRIDNTTQKYKEILPNNTNIQDAEFTDTQKSPSNIIPIYPAIQHNTSNDSKIDDTSKADSTYNDGDDSTD